MKINKMSRDMDLRQIKIFVEPEKFPTQHPMFNVSSLQSSLDLEIPANIQQERICSIFISKLEPGLYAKLKFVF